jgi:hypothetical protein
MESDSETRFWRILHSAWVFSEARNAVRSLGRSVTTCGNSNFFFFSTESPHFRGSFSKWHLLRIWLQDKVKVKAQGKLYLYGLDDRGSRVRFPAGAGNFSLHRRVQNGSEAHPASYPVGTRGSFPGGKAAGAWSWPLTSIWCRGQRMSGAIHPLPQYAFMAWCLVKHRDNFAFTLENLRTTHIT